jgi:hypothetical protein
MAGIRPFQQTFLLTPKRTRARGDTGLWIRLISAELSIDQVRVKVYDAEGDLTKPLETGSVFLPDRRRVLETSVEPGNQLWLLILVDPNQIRWIYVEAVGLRDGHEAPVRGYLPDVEFKRGKIKDYRYPLYLTFTGTNWHPGIPEQGEWSIIMVSSADAGEYSAITTDEADALHISHYDTSSESLQYTTNASGSWETSVIAKNIPRGSVLNTAIAVYGHRIHICYHASSLLKYAFFNGRDWSIQTLTDGGMENAIAVDSQGYVHIAFTRDGDLYYMTNKEGQWIYGAVDRGGYTGCRPDGLLGNHLSLAIDFSDHAHIAYYNSARKRLRYATNVRGSWRRRTLLKGGNKGSYNSIAIDSSGHIYISFSTYSDDDYGPPYFTTNSSGSWLSYTSADEKKRSTYTTIAVDSSCRVYMSYKSGNSLKLLTKSAAKLDILTIDGSSGYKGRHSSIAIDSSDYVHISYCWQEWPYGKQLRYATNAPALFAKLNVDTEGKVGMYSAIAFDRSGRLHISYFDETRGVLKYATDTGQGQWKTEIVDRTSYIVGKYTSIAVDSGDYVHISYIDYFSSKLKYARRSPGGVWEIQTIDSLMADNTGLAIDSSGRVHISYTGIQTNNYPCLKCAMQKLDFSGWEIQVVDQEGWVGTNSAIAVEASGRLHLSYRDSRYLKYATRAPGSSVWEICRIHRASGRTTSIAVDASGQIYILFSYRYSGSKGFLIYARRALDQEYWWATIIAQTPLPSEYQSIAIDRWGRLHISYIGKGGLRYAYRDPGLGWSSFTLGGREYNSIDVDARGQVAISHCAKDNLRCDCILYLGLHSFEAYNHPGYFIRHKNSRGEVSMIESELDRRDGTFRLVPGLADKGNGYISFEAINYPGHFLRCDPFMEIKLHQFQSAQGYREDATFRIVRGLADNRLISFESKYPGSFICHHASSGNYILSVVDRATLSETNRFHDATFTLITALSSE